MTKVVEQIELFGNYEINREPHFGPRLRRLLAASVLLHLLFVVVIAYVPSVQNALHLAQLFSGADYVDEDYTKETIRERAHIVNLSREGKLYYPPGYFSKQKETAKDDVEVVARATPTPTPTRKRVAVKPTPTPTPTPPPLTAPMPTAVNVLPEVAQGDKAGTEEGALTEEEKKVKEEQAKKEALDKLATENKTKLPPKINTKPFKDLLAKANEMYRRGEINLEGTIHLTLEADRNEDGTLTNMEMTGAAASDPTLKELAKELVQTLSASRALAFLEGVDHLRLALTLDQEKVAAQTITEMESAERASQMVDVYNAGLLFKRIEKRGTDEGAVWKSTTVSSEGRQIKVKFEMPRSTAGSLIAKQIPAK